MTNTDVIPVKCFMERLEPEIVVIDGKVYKGSSVCGGSVKEIDRLSINKEFTIIVACKVHGDLYKELVSILQQ